MVYLPMARPDAASNEIHAVIRQLLRRGADRDKSDCHFRKTATEYDRKPGIKRLSCAAK